MLLDKKKSEELRRDLSVAMVRCDPADYCRVVAVLRQQRIIKCDHKNKYCEGESNLIICSDCDEVLRE